MRKTLFFSLIACWLFGSCDNEPKTKPEIVSHVAENQDTVSGFPVTDYLKGQIAAIEKMPVTPLHLKIADKKIDSVWIPREEIRKYAAPFLHPIIDSTLLDRWYTGQSFLDQTTQSYTLTYDAKSTLPDSIDLRQVIIYISPQNQQVQRVYLKKVGAGDHVQQLTWVAGKWFSIRNLIPNDQKGTQVTEEKLVWNFRKE